MEEAGERSKVELHRVRGAENSLRVGGRGQLKLVENWSCALKALRNKWEYRGENLNES